MKILACLLIVLVHLEDAQAGGGKGSKHDILKIHVPEIIKHEHHTHYVFIHKHHKPKPKPKKHHGHFVKHWYVTGHKSGHKHGHKEKPKKPHKMEKPHHHKMKHHDYDYDQPSYEVTEQYDTPGYDYYQDAFPPQEMQYPTSYDISPYHQDEQKTNDYAEDVVQEDGFVPQDYSFQQSGFVDFGHEGFGEAIPSYNHHHKHYLTEVDKGIHTSNVDDKITKFTVTNDEEKNSDSFRKDFDDHNSNYS